MELNDVWDSRFLRIAQEVSTWSKDPSTKVGAVIVDNGNRVVSMGYNGFPQGVADDERLDDREAKYKRIVHAEMNALLFSSKPVVDCRIYTYPFLPCPRCAGPLIQAGINMVICPKNTNERWSADFEISREILAEAGVFLREI
jgi:dCMP deaminase